MQCPQCGSSNTQRLQIAFEGGTSAIKTQSDTVGFGLDGRVGVGTTRTNGFSQTTLGAKASPPRQYSFKKPIYIAILGWLVLSTNHSGFGTVFLFGAALLLGSSLFLFKYAKYNFFEWADQYQYWQQCWICHKCGNIYHQP